MAAYFQMLQEKLEKACEHIQTTPELFDRFVDRIEPWLEANAQRIADLFQAYDVPGLCTVTYDEFKSGKPMIVEIY